MVKWIFLSLLLALSSLHAEETLHPLILEASANPNAPLYPGQRVKFTYRIYYMGDIQLTKEQLPLLKVEEMKKLGSLETKETKKGPYSVQEISQEMRVIVPGTYSLGPSSIEGFILGYESGNPELVKMPVHAEALPVTVEVLPFPEEGKPVTFNGAVGQFIMQLQLLSPSQTRVGDPVRLELSIIGTGELDTVSLPNIFCQPGFSGFFQKENLPPAEKGGKTEKTFQMEMHAVSPFIKEIPKIEFSYFDPYTKKYNTLTSSPIPLIVQPLLSTIFSSNEERAPKKNEPALNWEKILSTSPNNEPLFPNEKMEGDALTKAYAEYTLAEKSKSVAEKVKKFNVALALYSKKQPENLSKKTRSKLFYNIGNCYFQLGEYAWAILFYERALALQSNSNAQKNLSLAQRRLFLAPATKSFSFPFSKYFSAIEGILVLPTMIYRGPDEDYTWTRMTPLFAGEKVHVLEIAPQGQWLKVRTENGDLGYVPNSTIRLIDGES